MSIFDDADRIAGDGFENDYRARYAAIEQRIHRAEQEADVEEAYAANLAKRELLVEFAQAVGDETLIKGAQEYLTEYQTHAPIVLDALAHAEQSGDPAVQEMRYRAYLQRHGVNADDPGR